MPAAMGGVDQLATLPRGRARRFASCVSELDTHRHMGGEPACTMQRVAQRCGGRIVPQAQAIRCDAAPCGDGGGFDDEHRGTAVEHIAPMHQMPIGGLTVVRRVLAHGGDDAAVGQGQGATRRGEGEFRKKVAQGNSKNKNACG
jgi:hypothetical protein